MCAVSSFDDLGGLKLFYREVPYSAFNDLIISQRPKKEFIIYKRGRVSNWDTSKKHCGK